MSQLVSIEVPDGFELIKSNGGWRLQDTREPVLSDEEALEYAPTVDYSTYSRVELWQKIETFRYHSDLNGENLIRMTGYCIVRMKGSLTGRIRKYASARSPSCANKYCNEVVGRYLRRIKYTEFDTRAMMDFYTNVLRRVSEGKYTTARIYDRHWGGFYYIAGNIVHEFQLSTQVLVNIKMMHQIGVKASKLEYRANKYIKRQRSELNRRSI